jgi:hypothetical protein
MPWRSYPECAWCCRRFGSATSGATASLQLDIGTAGPYYEQLDNITVYNRQDGCQDMLQCFGLELYSELDQFLEAHRFDGGSKSVYVNFFYRPPPPPRYATAASCAHALGSLGCSEAVLLQPCMCRMLLNCRLQHASWLFS